MGTSNGMPCAVVNWFVRQRWGSVTRMWVVEPELDNDGNHTFGIVPLGSIIRSCHLIGVFGEDFLPTDFHFSNTLHSFHSYYLNHYIDYHTFEWIA